MYLELASILQDLAQKHEQLVHALSSPNREDIVTQSGRPGQGLVTHHVGMGKRPVRVGCQCGYYSVQNVLYSSKLHGTRLTQDKDHSTGTLGASPHEVGTHTA